MSANIKSQQSGFTIVEVLLVITLTGLLVGPVVGGMFYFYSGMVANNERASLALEAQTVLRLMSQELLVSAGVRDQSAVEDPNRPGGWTTSNEDLVMIIATPALDSDNNFIIDPGTGQAYRNELVYYVDDGTLYKRTLAHPEAAGNSANTSCTQNASTTTCEASYPPDKVLSEHFKEMSFTFYDLNDQELGEEADSSQARSIKMFITMEDRSFGRTINFKNDIRVTLRNSLL